MMPNEKQEVAMHSLTISNFLRAYKKSGTKDVVYEKLRKRAQERNLMYYSEVAQIINNNFGQVVIDLEQSQGRLQVGAAVGVISEDEYNQNRPFISAIVVRKDRKPGEGFFRLLCVLTKPPCFRPLCERHCSNKENLLKLWSEYHSKKLKDLKEAWIIELKKVFDYWGK